MAGGRPLAFETPEDLQEAIDAYLGPNGDAWVLVDPELPKVFQPTMSGLAIALGVDRRTLTNYAERDEFFPAIKKARMMVEMALEQHLYGKNVTGAIFNLKNNFGWTDKQDLNITERVIDSGENEW